MDPKIVIMGVAGCGKTTIGELLAEKTGWRFIDGDALHPQENIDKMSSGVPLTDDDRWPWLEQVGWALAVNKGATMIGCSALKRAYRDHIREFAGGPVTFLHLMGSRELIGRRMKARSGHFMPTSLLDSQFEALEPPAEAERAVTADIAAPLDEVIAKLITELQKLQS